MDMLELLSMQLIQLNYCCQVAQQYDIFGLEIILHARKIFIPKSDWAETWQIK